MTDSDSRDAFYVCHNSARLLNRVTELVTTAKASEPSRLFSFSDRSSGCTLSGADFVAIDRSDWKRRCLPLASELKMVDHGAGGGSGSGESLLNSRKRKKRASRKSDGGWGLEKSGVSREGRVFDSNKEVRIQIQGTENEGTENWVEGFEESSMLVDVKASEECVVREHGKMQSNVGVASSTHNSEELVANNDGQGELSLDFNLNSPVLEVAEESRNKIERKLDGDGHAKCRNDERAEEIITIDSDTDERETQAEVFLESKVGGDNWEIAKFDGNKVVPDINDKRTEMESFRDGSSSHRRFTTGEKGKGVADDYGTIPSKVDLASKTKWADFSVLVQVADEASKLEESMWELQRGYAVRMVREMAQRRRENTRRDHAVARASASYLARFKLDELVPMPLMHEVKMPSSEAIKEMQDSWGPFFTALKIIKERNSEVNAKQNSLSSGCRSASMIQWIPSDNGGRNISAPIVPSLIDLCISVLAKNADALISLHLVPDELRQKLSNLLCDYGRMNAHFLGLLVKDCPTQIHVKECSQITEEQFTQIFQCCNMKNLRVLQLDLCGRCVPDYVLRDTLARHSKSLPALVTISLRGAYCLSNMGLTALVEAAPMLQSVNLGLCSLLTYSGIYILADSLQFTLRELYIDDSNNIDAKLIVPALEKFKYLEVLSVAGIQSVTDDFIIALITIHGSKIKELVLARCRKLTDISIKYIGNHCSSLRALDISSLNKLTDLAMQYLANGCHLIETLKLGSNDFRKFFT